MGGWREGGTDGWTGGWINGGQEEGLDEWRDGNGCEGLDSGSGQFVFSQKDIPGEISIRNPPPQSPGALTGGAPSLTSVWRGAHSRSL